MPPGRREKKEEPICQAAFQPSPSFDVITSVMVNFVETGGVIRAIILLVDYPDFAPAVGWKVSCKNTTYLITAVNGRKLTLEPDHE